MTTYTCPNCGNKVIFRLNGTSFCEVCHWDSVLDNEQPKELEV